VVAQCDSRLLGQWFEAEAELEIEFSIRSPWLKPGTYRVDVFLCAAGFIDQCEHACTFEVLPLLPYPATAGSEALDSGVILADFQFRTAPDEEFKNSSSRSWQPLGEGTASFF
jgi:lipopolysaccharide transport system ATP-binding protein